MGEGVGGEEGVGLEAGEVEGGFKTLCGLTTYTHVFVYSLLFPKLNKHLCSSVY